MLAYLSRHVDGQEAVNLWVQFGQCVLHHGGFPGSHGTDHHHRIEGSDEGGH